MEKGTILAREIQESCVGRAIERGCSNGTVKNEEERG